MVSATLRVALVAAFISINSTVASAQSTTIKWLRVSYAVEALHDIVYTTACVAREQCRELNQTFAPVMRRGGIEAAMMMKGAEHGAIILASERWERNHPTATKWLLTSLLGAQVAVNVHNWRELHRRP